MASLILGNIGSSLLGPIGGFLGSAIGSFVDNLLFAPSPEDIEGPRLEDLKAVQAEPGVPISLVFGADRVPGIVVHTTDLIETKHKEKVGGKGGGKSQQQISYTYHVDIDYMLCEGPILGIGRIWADGRLLRGTSYQMSLDTDENYEQIGGIPYSRWYKQHVYRPEETPWSYDPQYTPTILPQKYRWTPADGFEEISDAEALRLLEETKEVVYHYDTGSERMLPIPLSHDYTGELEPTGSDGDDGSYEGTTPSVNLQGFGSTPPPEDGQTFKSLVELNVPGAWDADNPTVVGSADATIVIEGLGNTPLGGTQRGWQITGEVKLEVWHEDPGSGIKQVGPEHTDTQFFSSNSFVAAHELTATVPLYAGSTMMQVSVQGARSSPALSTGNIRGGRWRAVWGTPGASPPKRDWPDYYNFYDAINDWSPKAVLQFTGPEGVAVYRGTDDQIADPTMELVIAAQTTPQERLDGSTVADDPAYSSNLPPVELVDDGFGPQGGTDGDNDTEEQLTIVPAYRHRAHVVFQRFELADFGNRIPNLTFEAVQSDDARIRPVLTELMTRAGIDTEYYDITALPEQGVRSYMLGYTIGTVTSYRAAMEPLLEAFHVDAAEVGNQIVFRPKARAYDHTIDYMDLQAIDVGSGPEAPIKLVFRDVVEMPRTLDVRYKDPEREYQTNTARFSRQASRSRQNSVLDLPAVMPPTLMKEYTRTKMRDVWLERISGAWTLPHKYLFISPSDICFINGSNYSEEDTVFKVTKVTRRDTGILEMEGVLRETTLYVPVDGETDAISIDRSTYQPQRNNEVALTTIARVYNLPLLQPGEADGGYYYALTGASDAWSGGTLYRNEGTSILPRYEPWENNEIGAKSGKTGFTDLMAVTNYLSIDRTSVVDVYLYNADETLESVTGEELLNGANAAMIGSEIVCFQNAVRQDDGAWRLTNFLRARRGTGYAVATHEWREEFVLLESAGVGRSAGDLTDIYDPDTDSPTQFKGVTYGDAVTDEEVISFENAGRQLTPFAPVMNTVAVEENGDLTITWKRQDRLAFEMVGAGDIANSEATETYEVTFGGNETTVSPTRRETVVDETTYTYTVAQQTADGYNTGTFTYAIAQVSDDVGAGFGARGTFTHAD